MMDQIHLPVEDTPDVTLSAVAHEDLPLLGQMMRPKEVYKNFGYAHPPGRMTLALAHRHGHMRAWWMELFGQRVGFMLLFGAHGPHSAAEFALAIAEPHHRGRGVAINAVLQLESLALGTRMAGTLWAWMDAANAPVHALAQRAGWPLTPRRRHGEAEIPQDALTLQLDAAAWLDLMARRAATQHAPEKSALKYVQHELVARSAAEPVRQPAAPGSPHKGRVIWGSQVRKAEDLRVHCPHRELPTLATCMACPVLHQVHSHQGLPTYVTCQAESRR